MRVTIRGACDAIDEAVANLRGDADVAASTLDEMNAATREMRELTKSATDECLSLFHDIHRRTGECETLVKDQLMAAASTPKRLAATERLLAALCQIVLDTRELRAALADVEDAV